MSISIKWLGVAGVVIKAGNEILAIDPFFTRPTLLELVKPITANFKLVSQYLPNCDFVLVTHSHYDHLLDVPAVIVLDRAEVYGSFNTCKLIRSQGVAAGKLHEVGVGIRFTLGSFEVEVVIGQHSPIPFSRLFNGRLNPGATSPTYAWDYKMDTCLGYRITAKGTRFLLAAAQPAQADVLFCAAQEPREYYIKMLEGVQPKILIPIHWDNFTRPLGKPLRKFRRPGRISVEQITALSARILPGCKVIIPELFTEVDVGASRPETGW